MLKFFVIHVRRMAIQQLMTATAVMGAHRNGKKGSSRELPFYLRSSGSPNTRQWQRGDETLGLELMGGVNTGK